MDDSPDDFQSEQHTNENRWAAHQGMQQNRQKRHAAKPPILLHVVLPGQASENHNAPRLHAHLARFISRCRISLCNFWYLYMAWNFVARTTGLPPQPSLTAPTPCLLNSFAISSFHCNGFQMSPLQAFTAMLSRFHHFKLSLQCFPDFTTSSFHCNGFHIMTAEQSCHLAERDIDGFLGPKLYNLLWYTHAAFAT